MTLPLPPLQSQRPQPLFASRLAPDAWLRLVGSSQPMLGGLGWGCSGPGLAPLHVPVLSEAGPWVDAWYGQQADVRSGRSGAVQWQADSDWAFGQLELPNADADLAQSTRSAYHDVFAALKDCGRPQVLRLWNYLPRINADGGGLERYRQFNIGRQQAFLDAGEDAFEGSPAACAIGLDDGPLALRFLAGRGSPLPLDNPRQVPAWRYPTAYGPRCPTFSRAALSQAGSGLLALWVSGTASIVGHATVHDDDVQAQVRETVVNLRAVVDAARQRSSADWRLENLHATVYVRHASDYTLVQQALEDALGAGSPLVRQAVAVRADICRAALRVEIEGHMLAAGVLQ